MSELGEFYEYPISQCLALGGCIGPACLPGSAAQTVGRLPGCPDGLDDRRARRARLSRLASDTQSMPADAQPMVFGDRVRWTWTNGSHGTTLGLACAVRLPPPEGELC